MRFTFIHAADLHIDSPLAGLRLKDEDVAKRFVQAGRRAVEALIAETIARKAAFLIIAGDVFDGDWKDVTTGLFFVGVISELHRAGIPAFIVKGNHDAESLMSRDLAYPNTVKIFPSSKAATLTLDDLHVALHGRSFPNRLTGDFVETYPPRRDGWLNIGVLHTSLDGTRGHNGYFQPQVRSSDGAVIGAEALLRWNHPDRGILAPGAFSDALCKNAVAIETGRWILMTACKTAASWRAKGLPPIRMGVNLFPVQFRNGSLLQDVEHVLSESGLPPEAATSSPTPARADAVSSPPSSLPH
jgi:UDP-2,3-diacylglucosamine pyrophosphatase LpxH